MRYVEMCRKKMVVVGMLSEKDIRYYKGEGYRLVVKEQLDGNKNGIKVIAK